MLPVKNILFPTDFSKTSLHAAQKAVGLCRDFNAKLTVLHVIELDIFQEMYGHSLNGFSDFDKRVQEIANSRMEDFISKLPIKDEVAVNREIQIGIPANSICQYGTERPVDLVVMATHGRKGLPRFFLGSVTERVVRMCPKPVLTLRAEEPNEE